ncbi:MAG: hypothetical protein QXG91_01725 [Candidatus Aenigmatarchaeota archaeon]
MSAFYEKTCNYLGKFLKLRFGEETEKKLDAVLSFCGFETNSINVLNATVLIALLTIAIATIFFLLKLTIFGLFLILIGSSLSLYLLYYPYILSKYVRITSSPDLILTILYMIISLKVIPNLENAVKFASENVKGYIGKQLRKLFYDLRIGIYKNADEALEKFSNFWKIENEEFYDAIETIRAAMYKSEIERNKIFEELVDTLLERNTDRMKIYAQNLKITITIITYMGIVLPVLVTIMMPILVSFLQTGINPIYIAILYNVVIPLTILILTNIYLKSFPTFLSEINFEEIGGNKIGYLDIKKVSIPIFPFSILIALIFFYIGYNIISNNRESGIMRLIGSEIIIFGIAISIIIYSFISHYKNSKIRDRIVKIEEEFPTALYNLGNLLTLGYSTESIIQKLNEKIKNLEIHELFEKALYNIKTFGFSFQKALFDKEIGAIKRFKSSLIENTMKIISEAMKMGGFAVSQSVITISNYLRSVKRVEMFSKEIFDDITSELNILLLLLIPLFCGIIVGVSGLITDIMDMLGNFFGKIVGTGNTTMPISGTAFLSFKFKSTMPAEYFSLIFGLYMIEISIITILFLSSLEGGKDKIKKYEKMTKILFIQIVLFIVSSFLVYSLSAFLPFQTMLS